MVPQPRYGDKTPLRPWLADLRKREAEALRLVLRVRELDAADEPDRNDDLVGLVVLVLVLADGDEAEAGGGGERVEEVAGAVGELDLDVRLLNIVLGRVPLDVAVERSDELVDRARRDPREPDVAQKSRSSRSTAAPTCSLPRSVAMRPRGVRWMNPS
jgi:hypothetical protein